MFMGKRRHMPGRPRGNTKHDSTDSLGSPGRMAIGIGAYQRPGLTQYVDQVCGPLEGAELEEEGGGEYASDLVSRGIVHIFA